MFLLGGSLNSELRKLLWVAYFYINLAYKLPWRKLTFICIFIFKEVVLFPGLAIMYFTSCIKGASVEPSDLA